MEQATMSYYSDDFLDDYFGGPPVIETKDKKTKDKKSKDKKSKDKKSKDKKSKDKKSKD
jgi:hypothetical protein